MKDKVFIGDSNILEWIPENATGDTEGTKISIDLMKQLLDENGPMPVLVDLSKAERPDKDQRNIIINGLRSNYHQISKLALFGETPILKAISYFILSTAGYSNMKFFNNRPKAISWLLENEPYASPQKKK